MKKKSIGINAVLNIIRIMIGIVFPVIAFPYASRTLGAEALGRVSFGESVIVFVSLFAMLGTSSYAVREGAAIRKDKQKFEKFASQIFSINLIAMVIAYVILFMLLLLLPKLAGYREIIFIQSIAVLFTTIGVEWIYTVFEDYFMITVRSIVVQILSLVALFVFVKTPDDFLNYVFITTIASAGVGLFNFFYVRKYCKVRFTTNLQLKRNLRPMLVLFSNDFAKKIYINSDVVMLGSMTSDFNVGLYRMSAKIYDIVKNIINSVVAVAIPRLAFYRKHDRESYNELNRKILSATIVLALPAVAGLVLLNNQIVRLVGGQEYTEASTSLAILSISLVFAVFANFFSNAVLIVNKAEKYAFRATIIAAVVNFVLNLVLIPKMQQNGAALTTCIAEIIVAGFSMYHARKFVRISDVKKSLLDSVIGCLGIVAVCKVVCMVVQNEIWQVFWGIICSVVVYFLILLIVRNELVFSGIKVVTRKIRSKKK